MPAACSVPRNGRARGKRGRSLKTGLLAAALGLLALAPGDSPAAGAPSWRTEGGEIRIVVPLKPGGAFEAKTTSLGGTLTLAASKPVSLTGELSVDLATIDTGISLRNRHLREKYLEVPKGRGFDKALLSELKLTEADGEAFQGRTGFTGVLVLHNMKRQLSGTADVRREGPAVRVVASFPLTLTDFGIEPPEYLGVGVGNKVLVKVDLSATPAGN